MSKKPPARTYRTAVAEYSDGSVGVLEVKAVTYQSGDKPFLSIGNVHGGGSVVVATPQQAKQIIEALNSAISEIWEAEE